MQSYAETMREAVGEIDSWPSFPAPIGSSPAEVVGQLSRPIEYRLV
jgi:hypothetical protein